MKNTMSIVVLGILIRLSVSDIKDRTISKTGLFLWGILTIVYQAVRLYYGNVHLEEIIRGVGIGAIFLIISWLTDEAIGYGDSVAIMILAGLLGFWGVAENLAWTFFINGIWTIGLVTIQWMKKRTNEIKSIPFIPFLTIGYVFVIIEQGGVL